MKTWVWVVIVAVILAVSLTVGVVLLTRQPQGNVAYVYVDGELVYQVDLSKVDQPYLYTVNTPYGSNVLEIAKDSIRIADADCPHKECVEQGRLTGSPLVCLPHRLVVKIAEDDADSVSR